MPKLDDYVVERRYTCAHPDELVHEYVRLPKPKNRFYGLSRTTWLEIAAEVPGMLITIRKRNAQRGINLLHLPTVLRYLDSLKEGQGSQSVNRSLDCVERAGSQGGAPNMEPQEQPLKIAPESAPTCFAPFESAAARTQGSDSQTE